MNSQIETKNGQRGLVKKPTGFLSSSRCVRQELDKKCTGDHVHVQATCRGVARQQREDASLGVSAGKLSADEVRSFAHYICNLNEGERSGIQRIQSITETKDGAAPIGGSPEHWVDSWHELEGGNDLYESRPQYGASLLQAETNGLSYKSGSETAWDDVSN